MLTSRRGFIQRGAVAAAALPAIASTLASCRETKADPAPAAPTTPALPPPTSRQKADEMDAMHEKGVKAFPAKTEGRGNQLIEPRLEKGVKVYELTAEEIQWEVEPGRKVKAWAYNGQVPGPQIRVREGDRVRVHITNKLPESTAIHFHGLELPNDQDGVPFITQPPIKPGESYTYEFTVPNDGSHGYTLNGKGFPATEPIVCKQGQTVRLRFMNEGMMIHPMHLHGMHMTVIAKDGWDQPAPWKCDTLNIAPGERWDVLVKANNPGTWAFHCHILPHAESEHGMFGMVTALIVQKPGVA